MNLYKLHTKPEELLGHDAAHELVPKLAWADSSKRTKEYEHVFAKDAKYAYNYAYYARGVLKGPFKAGEAAIAKAGETAIVNDAQYAYLYAHYVLKDPLKVDK